ncbi:MAG: hypothetical protein ACREHV_10175 [Rhizomicrobium sp.]
MRDKQKTRAEKPAKKRLLDPNGPRVDVTATGGEFAGRHPTESEPGIVHPGGAPQATGQTTHE